MRRVIVESPYSAPTAGGVLANIEYARCCMADALSKDESPFLSHLLYTQPGVLRDEIPSERQQGIEAGFAWIEVADEAIVYVDHGVSRGMVEGVKAARRIGKPVSYRAFRDGDQAVTVSCPCLNTEDEPVWAYGIPDSSGWDRECNLCGRVQRGTFPCPV